jgi:solute carrier family 25 citrate transporter 1
MISLQAVRKNGIFSTGSKIIRREGTLALYKGLGAVVSGIVPKMAIRFSSFEMYKGLLNRGNESDPSFTKVFVSGLLAGTTEAVLVVTPMDVLKIRLQAQHHSLADPLDIPKYRNVGHAAYLILKEEGISTFYRGVALTALRQATNQAVNFTAYQYLKNYLLEYQNLDTLPSYQHLLAGGISGAMGPISNAPIDTIKTRIQKSPTIPGQSGWTRFSTICTHMLKNEGWRAFYKGLTPRLLRVAPGQAITFMVYEKIQKWLTNVKLTYGEDDTANDEN